MKPWVVGIFVFLLWSAGSTYWYVCKVKGLCYQSEAESKSEIAGKSEAESANGKESESETIIPNVDSADVGAGSEAGNTDSTPVDLPADLQKPHTVLFAFAGPQPENPAAFANYLDQIASFLKSHPGKKALIRGYTDDTAARENNIKLAQRRCDVVVGLLFERGVKDGQIATEPLGEVDPVATNDTPEGRRLNRRVVISIQE